MLKKDFTKKRLGYIKCCIHTRYNSALAQIELNRMTRHVSVDAKIVIRTCENGTLKYHKYQDIEAEVEEFTKKLLTKNRRNDCEQSYYGIRRRSDGMTMSSHEEETLCEGQEHEKMKTETSHFACEAKIIKNNNGGEGQQQQNKKKRLQQRRAAAPRKTRHCERKCKKKKSPSWCSKRV